MCHRKWEDSQRTFDYAIRRLLEADPIVELHCRLVVHFPSVADLLAVSEFSILTDDLPFLGSIVVGQ